ncbi:hypothetical protein TNCV_1665981 [Trichonephila clavipes]|nr:hypothetical protein TNCV_1665981 [Trichonephila clavipes]
MILSTKTDVYVQIGTMTSQIYPDIIMKQNVRLFRGIMHTEFVFMDVNAHPHRVTDDFNSKTCNEDFGKRNMPGKRARRHFSQLSEFERGLIIGMRKLQAGRRTVSLARWIVRSVPLEIVGSSGQEKRNVHFEKGAATKKSILQRPSSISDCLSNRKSSGVSEETMEWLKLSCVVSPRKSTRVAECEFGMPPV